MDSDRSGTDVERLMDEAGTPSAAHFFASDAASMLSSFEAAYCAAVVERLDEPEVEAVDSDDDDVWVWCASLAGLFCRACEAGADVDLTSWRSCGVLEKAYGAIGAAVPR